MPASRHGIPFSGLDSDRPVPVIALHCSGADGRQWRSLAAALDAPFFLVAPDFCGSADQTPWHGSHAFHLADEAAPLLDLIDSTGVCVHLIGHSYGGGVALHIARMRPQAIASLTLYEPSAFHLLKAAGPAEAEAFAEIRDVAEAAARGLATGDYQGAAVDFIDYWGGPGAWQALRPNLQAALVRWLPKAPLDFHALIEEPASLDSYRTLDLPVLILRGALAPRPTARIAALLADALPDCRIETVDGAGHMGPITHAGDVNARIRRFLKVQQPEFFPRRVKPQAPAAANS